MQSQLRRVQGTVPGDFLEGGEPPKAAKGLALALALAPLDEDDEEVDSVTRVRTMHRVKTWARMLVSEKVEHCDVQWMLWSQAYRLLPKCLRLVHRAPTERECLCVIQGVTLDGACMFQCHFQGPTRNAPRRRSAA